MFSSYDIKKIVPRAVFALIAANLSWSLLIVIIKMVNALGDIVTDLILAPFTSANLTTVTLGDSSSAIFGTLAAAAVVTAGATLIPVMGLAIPAVLGLFFAFVIVLLRRIILVFMIIFSPVAIAFSIFPQTEKFFKEWWEWFFKILLMYPFIMAMLAMSRVGAGILGSGLGASNGFSKFLQEFGAIVLLIAPYFMFGKALQFAGGTMAKLSGIVNSKNSGLIDGAKKWEAGKVKESRADAAAGARYRSNRFTKPINKVFKAAMNPGQASPLKSKASKAASDVAKRTKAIASLEETRPSVKTVTDDERAIMMESGGSKGGAKEYIESAMVGERAKKISELRDRGVDYRAGVGKTELDEHLKARRMELERAAASAGSKYGSYDSVAASHALINSGASTSKGEVQVKARQIASQMGGSIQAQDEYAKQLTTQWEAAASKSLKDAEAAAVQALASANTSGDAVAIDTATKNLNKARNATRRAGFKSDTETHQMITTGEYKIDHTKAYSGLSEAQRNLVDTANAHDVSLGAYNLATNTVTVDYKDAGGNVVHSQTLHMNDV